MAERLDCPTCHDRLDCVICGSQITTGHYVAVAEIERLQRLLWECNCAASDGIPVPFERWRADGGPDEMPADVRYLRDAFDTFCEERDRYREALAQIAEARSDRDDIGGRLPEAALRLQRVARGAIDG